jgi:uncharacterized protein YlxP (DUF503 family)
MHVLALSVELHLPECRSLKAKRATLKPIIEGARRRYGVAVAETAHQNTWQRSQVAVAVVSGSASHATEVMDEVERYIWSCPDAHVLSTDRYWLEAD